MILGHRGAPRLEPENTLAAFDRALREGADGVELDVRRTCDGALVVHHDADRHGRLLSEMTYADLCASLPSALRPPELREVVALVGGRGFLDVELKEGGYEAAVLATLFSLPRSRLIMSSFLRASIVRVKDLDASVPTSWLTAKAAAEPFSLPLLRDAGADVAGLSVELADAGTLAQAQAYGIGVHVWTVNDAETLRRLLADPRVDAVITDEPGRAAALRNAA